MAEEAQVSQEQDQKISDKEMNFRAQQAKYERIVSEERAARIEAQRIAQELIEKKQQEEDQEEPEPFVSDKKLQKSLQRFGEQTQKQNQNEIQRAVQNAIEEEKKNNWIEQNPDFYDVIEKNAQKIYQAHPELAKTILKMPDGFERQKLVYANIKALGLHNPETKPASIQEKIDANRRSPYYQPTGVGNAPYAQVGDFSESGQKQSYDKMKDLQKRMRL